MHLRPQSSLFELPPHLGQIFPQLPDVIGYRYDTLRGFIWLLTSTFPFSGDWCHFLADWQRTPAPMYEPGQKAWLNTWDIPLNVESKTAAIHLKLPQSLSWFWPGQPPSFPVFVVFSLCLLILLSLPPLSVILVQAAPGEAPSTNNDSIKPLDLQPLVTRLYFQPKCLPQSFHLPVCLSVCLLAYHFCWLEFEPRPCLPFGVCIITGLSREPSAVGFYNNGMPTACTCRSAITPEEWQTKNSLPCLCHLASRDPGIPPAHLFPTFTIITHRVTNKYWLWIDLTLFSVVCLGSNLCCYHNSRFSLGLIGCIVIYCNVWNIFISSYQLVFTKFSILTFFVPWTTLAWRGSKMFCTLYYIVQLNFDPLHF